MDQLAEEPDYSILPPSSEFIPDDTTTLVAVVLFGASSICSGTSGAYRIDQPDDLAFLATFGIFPPEG